LQICTVYPFCALCRFTAKTEDDGHHAGNHCRAQSTATAHESARDRPKYYVGPSRWYARNRCSRDDQAQRGRGPCLFGRQGPTHEADATFVVAAIIAATGIVGSFFLKNFHSDGTRQVQASSNLFRSAMDALGGIGER